MILYSCLPILTSNLEIITIEKELSANTALTWLQVPLLLPLTNIFVAYAKRTFPRVRHCKFTCELIQETVLLAVRSVGSPLQQRGI